jgi:hypothetical protein
MPVVPASAANVIPPAPPPLSGQQEQQVLLEAEEIASVRDMVPLEALPPEFPPLSQPVARVPCAFCGEANPAGNRYCERCGQSLKSSSAAPSAAAPVAAPAAHSAWLDVPEPARKPVAAPAPARTPALATAASAPAPQPAATAPAKNEDFFYFYDDNSSPRGNRKLLIALMVVLALGVLGVIYLMSRPSAKNAAPGNITITISPADAQTEVGGSQDFTASVTGSGDIDVTWSVAEGIAGGTIVNRGVQAQGGTLASLGAYSAPPTPGTFHVIATSKADTSKSATAEVLVSGK